MHSPDWTKAFDQSLAHQKAVHRFRQRHVVQASDAVHIVRNGRRLVNFSSNNYLGLTHHPRIIAAMTDAAQQHGAGAGAAGLISGFSPIHASAERAIADWKGTEAAVLLPSGYQANHAAIQSLAGIGGSHRGGVRFLVDKLSHASLIDAVRGSSASFRIFPHNGIDKLHRLLLDAPAEQLQVVVTESIFSMDGNAANLQAIVALKRERDFLLLLDEAHGGGVYGPGGAGLAAEWGVADAVDLTMATFSKAAGLAGGAICGSVSACQAVVNFGRAYIFSTAVPPGMAAAIEAAIGVMKDEPDRARRVRQLSQRMRQALSITATPMDSPIIPIILGPEEKAITAAGKLQEQGMLAMAVRPPTVPAGGSRLRITLSSEHSDEEVAALIDAVGKLA
jgi:8-amino-7-oxononanoate synthase